MSFNGQPNIFLARLFLAYVTYTSKVKHFEPTKHNFLSNGIKTKSSNLQPFPSKFQNFEIFVSFGFFKFIQ